MRTFHRHFLDAQRCALFLAFLLLPATAARAGIASQSEIDFHGPGLGIDIQGISESPIYSVGYGNGSFGAAAYLLRGSAGYRPTDKTTFVRAGGGLGLAWLLLSCDFTYQAGPFSSAGLLLAAGLYLVHKDGLIELFFGHQVNFAPGTDNFFSMGAKVYFNLSKQGR